MQREQSATFDNSYARLPETFYTKLMPERMPSPKILRVNTSLANLLQIEDTWLKASFLGGQELITGSEPLAQVYSGHQFGNFVPQLGDGRAILLGEIICADNIRRDIQLKGSGRTPYSRMGDGRAALGPVMREFLVSEALHHLNIPTTRSLAALYTGETLMRDGPTPGAILVRVGKSHVRIGTFQYFAAKGDYRSVKILSDYVIARHYPEISDKNDKYSQLLRSVVFNQAKLIAKWMSVGFIHGVMNTDNMTLSGETIDFGPCAFLDTYIKEKVYSSIDIHGRYSYSNQPLIAKWNLSRFAETLLQLIDEHNLDRSISNVQQIINEFNELYSAEFERLISKKLGFRMQTLSDKKLHAALFKIMEEGQADFTLTFRSIPKLFSKTQENDWYSLFKKETAFKAKAWAKMWKNRMLKENATANEIIKKLNKQNPSLIPRNHFIEKAISMALKNDLTYFNTLATEFENPFLARKKDDKLLKPPLESEEVKATYCGT